MLFPRDYTVFEPTSRLSAFRKNAYGFASMNRDSSSPMHVGVVAPVRDCRFLVAALLGMTN